MIKIKSVYKVPEKDDGFRILVDKLWPSGLSKDELKLDLWIKDIAPSNDIIILLNNSEKWDEFRENYLDELKGKKDLIKQLKILEKFNHIITLVYTDNDNEHNNSIVLLELLKKPQKQVRMSVGRIHGS
jgi:uncharacterized protein YeaO (DUF488 family)